jgi:murein DD-endopeptidase MepM/ murein hydrolase activator NlpD
VTTAATKRADGRPGADRSGGGAGLLAAVLVLAAGGCAPASVPPPQGSPDPVATATPTPTPTPTPSPTPAPTPAPTPTPDPDGDGDGDGFTPAEGDCDDGDPSVRPTAWERCDGEDNDCDGEIDEVGLLVPGSELDDPPELLPAERLPWPVEGLPVIAATFGPRWQGSQQRFDFHRGLDLAGERGASALAVADGVVRGVYPVGSESYPTGGNVVVVEHPIEGDLSFHGAAVDTLYAVYMHLDSVDVLADEAVAAGSRLGGIGDSGAAENVHLHFELRVQSHCSLQYQLAHPDASCVTGYDPHVNPLLFLVGEGGDGFEVEVSPCEQGWTARVFASRSDLDLDAIRTDAGAVGFDAREGLDASSPEALDDLDLGWVALEPANFTAETPRWELALRFAAPPGYLELVDVEGVGRRFDP